MKWLAEGKKTKIEASVREVADSLDGTELIFVEKAANYAWSLLRKKETNHSEP